MRNAIKLDCGNHLCTCSNITANVHYALNAKREMVKYPCKSTFLQNTLPNKKLYNDVHQRSPGGVAELGAAA